jgi:hypothetical protein
VENCGQGEVEKRRVVSKYNVERTTGTGWRMVDRERVEKRRVVSKDNVERMTGTRWRMVDRERVEKRRVVSKDNVERRTGRGWRRGEECARIRTKGGQGEGGEEESSEQ